MRAIYFAHFSTVDKYSETNGLEEQLGVFHVGDLGGLGCLPVQMEVEAFCCLRLGTHQLKKLELVCQPKSIN